MRTWTFYAYVSASGRCEIETWYRGLHDDEKAKVDFRLDYLERMQRIEWRHPMYEQLSGSPGKGIGEIRVRVQKVQRRLLGFFGTQTGQFIVVLNARKHSKNGKTKWIPNDALKTANKRKCECENNPERYREWRR